MTSSRYHHKNIVRINHQGVWFHHSCLKRKSDLRHLSQNTSRWSTASSLKDREEESRGRQGQQERSNMWTCASRGCCDHSKNEDNLEQLSPASHTSFKEIPLTNPKIKETAKEDRLYRGGCSAPSNGESNRHASVGFASKGMVNHDTQSTDCNLFAQEAFLASWPSDHPSARKSEHIPYRICSLQAESFVEWISEQVIDSTSGKLVPVDIFNYQKGIWTAPKPFQRKITCRSSRHARIIEKNFWEAIPTFEKFEGNLSQEDEAWLNATRMLQRYDILSIYVELEYAYYMEQVLEKLEAQN
ncbi:hypothetical protein J3R30DRAFT_3893745 [Lentinula aciculospora]|uniref:Uncharacterized protein n=1 Tax=Lentinula aciculospora TaxID=153920 RepID=A0A9W8ZSN0_9AGAR|nr:hypothetical protein J3R30DRAFT_3893745 [Lentinula aciculospora]